MLHVEPNIHKIMYVLTYKYKYMYAYNIIGGDILMRMYVYICVPLTGVRTKDNLAYTTL